MYYKISMNPQGKYYPKSITKGKVISTKKVAEKLAQISTVSEADARAVLSMLGEVMADYLASGRSVKLDGLGSLRLAGYTGDNKAVEKPEQVTSKMFQGVRVRFIPESTQKVGGAMTRAMTSGEVDWILLTEEQAASGDFTEEDQEPGSDSGSTGGSSDSGSTGTGSDSGSTGGSSTDDEDSPFKP